MGRVIRSKFSYVLDRGVKILTIVLEKHWCGEGGVMMREYCGIRRDYVKLGSYWGRAVKCSMLGWLNELLRVLDYWGAML